MKQAGEPGIAGATVRLDRHRRSRQCGESNCDDRLPPAPTRFSSLRPGTYALTEDQPAGYADGKDTIGTPGGTAGNDQFTNIVLAAGVVGRQQQLRRKVPGRRLHARRQGAGRGRGAAGQPGQVSPQSGRFLHHRGACQRHALRRRGHAAASRRPTPTCTTIPISSIGPRAPCKLRPCSTSPRPATIDAANQQIDEAGGAFDLALNGSHYPGAGTPQLLFTVAGQVSAAAAHGSTVTLGLDPADVAGHDTMVYGNSVAVAATYQSASLLIGSLWRNPTNQWDVDGNGVANAADESAVISQLSAARPQLLPDTRPAGSPMVDVDGNGVLNWLDALLIHQQHLSSSRVPPAGAATTVASAATAGPHNVARRVTVASAHHGRSAASTAALLCDCEQRAFADAVAT